MSRCRLGIESNVILSHIYAVGDASGWMGYMCRCVRDSESFRGEEDSVGLVIYSVCNDRLWRTANAGICYTFRCVHRGSKMSGCEEVAGNGLRPYKLRAMLSFCYFFA